MADQNPEIGQGALIRVICVYELNPPTWGKWRGYTSGELVKYKGKIYVAAGSSAAGEVPGISSAWTLASGRVDPDGVTFTLVVPGFPPVIYTPTSFGTIIVKDDVGVYFAYVDTTPAYGDYEGQWFVPPAFAAQDEGRWSQRVLPSPPPLA